MTQLSPIRLIGKPQLQRPLSWNIANTTIARLQVILKTVERCNINCSYCYYFNGGDNSWEARPPVILPNAVEATAQFLVAGARDLGIPEVQIVFHGGEPMMQSKDRFDQMCRTLYAAFSDSGIVLTLAMQTNGTLVDEEWCDLLSRYRVGVGISLDGPKHVNDKYRLDHKGRSTYDATVAGLKCLRDYEARTNSSFGLGSLTVINPEYDYAEIYRHLTKDLGFRKVGFLLPDCCHDTYPQLGASQESYGKALRDIFDVWRASPIAQITHIERAFRFFRNGELSLPVPAGERLALDNQIIVVHSDGTISIDDSLIPASGWRNTLSKGNTATTSLRQWLNSDFYADIFMARRDLPAPCQPFSWKNLCQGGDIENRYSAADNFARPSVFCGALDAFYGHLTSYLLDNGYPDDVMLNKLS